MRLPIYHFALLAAPALPTATLAQQKLKYPKPQPDQIYDAVTQPAVPVGGLDGYAQYLADNQQYPAAALQRGAAGTVTVTFVVEKSGSISNAVVAAPLDPDLDAEALRLITLDAGPEQRPESAAAGHGAHLVPDSTRLRRGDAAHPRPGARRAGHREQPKTRNHGSKSRPARPARGGHGGFLGVDSEKPAVPGAGPAA
jgi:protein TonB